MIEPVKTGGHLLCDLQQVRLNLKLCANKRVVGIMRDFASVFKVCIHAGQVPQTDSNIFDFYV